MDIYTRQLIASSELFGGFQIDIDIRKYDTSNDIITHFKDELLSVLNMNHLEELYKKCQDTKFHIHTHTYEEVLLETEYPIYLCDHCQC
tara:strand:+ start:393 stop:659 length:267 start_codon:yes stop_codon:yes gene_type:complete